MEERGSLARLLGDTPGARSPDSCAVASPAASPHIARAHGETPSEAGGAGACLGHSGEENGQPGRCFDNTFSQYSPTSCFIRQCGAVKTSTSSGKGAIFSSPYRAENDACSAAAAIKRLATAGRGRNKGAFFAQAPGLTVTQDLNEGGAESVIFPAPSSHMMRVE